MTILVPEKKIKSLNVLATKRLSRKTHSYTQGIRAASVGLFFVNGNADSIKIVANAEGIQALKDELDQAEKSIRRNNSYFFGDPLWMKSPSKLVVIEPTQSRRIPETDMQVEAEIENTDLAPRLFLFSLVMIAVTLMTVGVITICQWIF